MKKLIRISGFSVITLLVFIYMNSCVTSSTVITGIWEKPSVEKNYNNIIVEALVPKMSTKSSIEQEVVDRLKAKGIEASRSKESFPSGPIESSEEKAEILDEIQDDGADGILTISLIDQEAESRYIPGPSPYSPYPNYSYYGTLWGYYDYWYPYFYGPGYYTMEKVYYIETNLFDAETEELVWSAQSKTYEQPNLAEFARDYAREIADKLEDDNIFSMDEE